MTHILLADDSVTIQKIVELTFSDGPYMVTSVSNGDKALESALQLKPDLVIADVFMPGLTGYGVCAEVKKKLPTTPVLLLIGTFEPLNHDAVEKCAADGVITKPFDSGALIEQVDRLTKNARNTSSDVPPPLGHQTVSFNTAAPELRIPYPAPPGDQRPRVFLCHASEDKPAVRDLYQQFLVQGFHPWLDEEDLLPGEDWKRAITKQLRQCDAVVVCLSRRSVTKTGFVQKEIAVALDILAEHPEGSIFVIPLLLEDCEIPERLSHLHAARLKEGFTRVCRAIRRRGEMMAAESKQ